MIRHKLPADKTKVQFSPSRDEVLVLLQKEFDEDDIANDKYDNDTSADSSSNSESTDLNDSDNSDDEPPMKSTWTAKK